MATRTREVTRRRFNQGMLGVGAAALAAPAILRAQTANRKLNIAVIGAGGRGAEDTSEVKSENIVALCDVNSTNLEAAAKRYPSAKKFADFREMFDKAAGDFEAVVIATCEHTHASATMLALKNDKHVYCEKPLTHDIWEARQIREMAATKPHLATQMGIQIHGSENYHRVVELVRSGVIGPIREAHVWVSRAWGLQDPEEAKKRDYQGIVTLERPREEMAPPANINWDLWIGPAPYRPFNDIYVPGPKWYRWWDFGNGTMSDLGSHYNDLLFWALQLEAPLTVEASGPPPHPEIAPASMSATYEYGARGNLPPVKLTWHQGENKPQIWTDHGIPQWSDGHLFIGDKGMILSNYTKHIVLPEADFKDFKTPEPTLPRVSEHHAEWIECCKTGKTPAASFQYGGLLTEANHLGNVAYRVGKKLQWDTKSMRATNAPEADVLIRCPRRKGWEL